MNGRQLTQGKPSGPVTPVAHYYWRMHLPLEAVNNPTRLRSTLRGMFWTAQHCTVRATESVDVHVHNTTKR